MNIFCIINNNYTFGTVSNMNETIDQRFSLSEFLSYSIPFKTRKSMRNLYMEPLIKLYDAIVDGKSNEIREMKNDALFDYFHIQDWTNLLSDVGTHAYNPDTISALVYCINDINNQSEGSEQYEYTILSVYCSHFFDDFYAYEIICSLLEHNANPTYYNCFYEVCNNNIIDYRILDILIAYGADVNEVSCEDYYTPYQKATLMENYKLKRYLVKHGAIQMNVLKDKPLYSDII